MIDVKEVKCRVSIKECLEFYGIKFNRNNFACCPFHGDKTPSLKVGEHVYTCFACGATGDVVDFVSQYFSLTFKEGLAKIDKDFNLNLNKSFSEEEKEEIKENRQLDKAFNRKVDELAKKEKVAYDQFCDEMQVLNTALINIEGKNKEAVEMIKDRIDEIENILDDPVLLRMEVDKITSLKNREREKQRL